MRLPIIAPLYDLRWRLEYFDGKAPKYGQWTRPEIDYKNMGSFHDRNGLSKACIEVRNKKTFQTKIIVHCNSSDFQLFQWIYAGRIGASNKIFTQKIIPQVVGLKIVTSKYEAIVFVNSDKVKIMDRKLSEQNYNFACFGK